jgi:hypothetical protein
MSRVIAPTTEARMPHDLPDAFFQDRLHHFGALPPHQSAELTRDGDNYEQHGTDRGDSIKRDRRSSAERVGGDKNPTLSRSSRQIRPSMGVL